MEFDKSRVYTALNADELKIGSKVIFADDLATLKNHVSEGDNDDIETLVDIRPDWNGCRFEGEGSTWALAYLVSEPEEKELKWTDLKVGDVVRHKEQKHITYMVTGVDGKETTSHHIYFANTWISDNGLTGWEKVEG